MSERGGCSRRKKVADNEKDKEKENKDKAVDNKKKEKSGKKKKKIEPVKSEEPQIKTEENVKKEPPKISFFAYRLGDANVMTHLFNHIIKLTEKNNVASEVLYERDIESNQTSVIDLGLSLKFDFIILNGLNMSEQKITKIKAYIEELNTIKKDSNVSSNEVINENVENATHENTNPEDVNISGEKK